MLWGGVADRLADTRFVSYVSVDLNWDRYSWREYIDVNAAQGCCGSVEDTALEWHGQMGDNNVDRRRRVKLVNHVPTAWGSPCSGCPLLGMPPLLQAGDGPPSSEGC